MPCSYPYSVGDEPVPGYRLVAFLGRGGFGEVWKATAPGGTESAVKIINLAVATGRKEFRALRLVRCIRHPNLVPITAFWLKDKHGLILDDAYAAQVDLASSKTAAVFARETMLPNVAATVSYPEPVELIIAMGLGQTNLFDRLRQCQQEGLPGIPDDELIGYMQDVAKAIDYLNRPIHDLGHGEVAIQHCDIKPHNMLLVGGAVQLCDFGLACILGDLRGTTATAATIAYAAPEYLDKGKPSAASDQYSLAISYYELKTGALPFDTNSFAQVSNAVLRGEMNLSRLPPAQQAVLRRATALDPAKRFPTAGDMVAALAQALKSPAPKSRRRIKTLAAVVLLLIALVAGGLAAFQWLKQTPRQIASDELARAREEQQAGRLAQAIALYSQAIEHYPTAEAYYQRGNARLPDDPDTALADFQRAARLDPAHRPTQEGLAHAHLLRAQSLYAKDRLAEALGDASMVIERYAESAGKLAGEARLLRGRIETKQGNYDAAIADLQRLRNDDPSGNATLPELAQAYFRRGRGKLTAGDYEGALSDFDAARAVDPAQYGTHAEYVHALVGRGEARQGKGSLAEALADFTLAIDQHPSHAAAAYCARGSYWLAQNEYDKALADLTKAVELSPQDSLAWRQRGTCLLDKEDFEAAARDLTKAIELNPNDALAYDRRGFAWLSSGKFADALADFDEEIKREPNALAYFGRGRAHQQRGDADAAIADFGRSLELNPSDPDTYFYRANVRIEQGRLADAMPDLDQAIRLNARFVDAFRLRGACAALRGDFAQAIADFGQVIAFEPEDAEAYAARGEAEMKPGIARYEQALADLTKASSLDKASPLPWQLLGWLRATCPLDNIRDGQQAIAAATQACKLTTWSDPDCLDALAAAYAEAGRFSEAADWEKKAIELAPDDAREKYNQRLALYQRGKPFRETTVAPR
jgi:tetratricopeptide (TPR) repeat protein